jgi:stage IV sporulation protein B
MLSANTQCGIFGRLDDRSMVRGLTPLPVADREEITAGPASILSNISGDEVKEYSIEIIKIFAENPADPRDFMVRVTDPALLAATGGVVQGMSGSPIVQNGKLVGAVTHVLVNDPTRGYGIFIENMLEAAK